ncbi:hypothetical protein PCANC_28965 [Puccinia coronata f. sp. avenae]|uniref:Retrotransposon gag domain-containing protein n=1 Tax=Puccinia coronata f. sp. avenae TaxID=200324 RepID=A0A2N5S5T7_9BASI|nr:hypothetical protein PCANC_28965 [Puccinia coronata f. sp. avenae]
MQEDPPTDNVSQLLAGLKIDASSHSNKISSQNKCIETQNQSIQQLKTEFADMKMAFQTEIIKLHNIINSTEHRLTNANQGVNQRFEQLDNRLLDLHVSTANLSGPKGILDVPVHPHINFAGLPKETDQFVFFIQEALITSAGRFADEKQKIMWIASFFHQKGSNVEGCPSHNWWRGLLHKNAAAQGLPTVNASSHAPYVIDELKSAQLFITALEATFTNHREAEESREKLQLIRQTRDQSIEEFNIIFNMLLFMVDMDSVSKCDLYQSAVNPIIHELGIMRGGWASIKDLESKQAMAVQLYHDDEGMKLAKRIKKASNSSHAPPRIEHKINPSQHSTSIPQSKVVDSSPASDPMAMDLDSIVAEMKFSYAVYRILCRQNQICQRCGFVFDKDHVHAKICPKPTTSWLPWAQ